MVTELSPEDYTTFVRPDNWAAQLLLTHAFLIEYIVGAAVLGQMLDKFPFRDKIAACWIRHLSEKLPAHLKSYIEWPLKFGQSLLQSPASETIGDNESNS